MRCGGKYVGAAAEARAASMTGSATFSTPSRVCGVRNTRAVPRVSETAGISVGT
jgi:hypothetical protein